MTKPFATLITTVSMMFIFILTASCSKNEDTPQATNLFKLNISQISIEANGGSNSFFLISNQPPTLECTADWIKLYTPDLSDAKSNVWTIKFDVAENKDNSNRSTSILIKANNNRASVKIDQKGATLYNPDIANYQLPTITFPTDDNIGETAKDAVKHIFAGWNLGNTLEPPTGEGTWGNPLVNKELIKGIKAAGFNAIRIPCAWHSHLVADAEPYTIKAEWMKRVHEVVDYAYSIGMYVILNTHWDGGWLELHANMNDCEAVVKKERALWTQIANEFANYGERLIFAGNNEIRNTIGDNENWGMPSADEQQALAAYNQAFIDAVRATGGKNSQRNLAIQSWCCNPWRALDSLTLPTDNTKDHLLVEVHFYDPMDFTHTESKIQHWGYRKGYYTADNNNQEDYIDNLFGQLKKKYVDNGYPIILGEYGTVCHTLTDRNKKISERYYLEYVTQAAKDNGMAPFYWDNGQPKVGTFGIIDRNTGAIATPHMLHGIIFGACAGKYPY